MPTPSPASANWPTGFMLIQGNRLEELRALLVAWIQRHPLAPLENETILVQSNGIAQWLKLALATHPAQHESDRFAGGLGIAAALDVVLPARFMWRVYRAVLGALPETSPFDKAPLTWRLYRLLERLTDQQSSIHSTDTLTEALAPLRGFLTSAGSDAAPRRRYQLAERLADLLDQYQVYRADWLAAWSEGRDSLIRPNGAERPIPAGQAWQPVLWRALQADVAAECDPNDPPLRHASRAQVHQQFLAQAGQLTASARQRRGLPRRVIVFGLSALPRQMLEVLEALAPVTQVIVFALNPSRHYWGDIIEGRDLFRRPYRRHRARKVPEDLDERELHLHGHPLLAAWGKQGRDYLRLLDEQDERLRYEAQFRGLVANGASIDLFTPAGDDCLLHQLQDDLLELRPLHERQAQQTVIDPAQDRSVEFVIAHSPQREIEILHDRLLAEFERSARTARPLHPREVLVMVPDIAIHAPHIQAVFGRFERSDPRHIPFQITDQGQRHRNPLVIGLEQLLNLPRARLTVSDVLDLLDIPALRARFDLTEAAVRTLRTWIAGAQVRWGLSATHRASLGLPAGLEQNTWRFGLRRLLLGFASGAAGAWREIEPHDEVGGLEAALLGPLTLLLDRLELTWQQLREARAPTAWVALMSELLETFFMEVSDSDGVILARMLAELDAWAEDCAQGGLGEEPIALEIFREALLARLDQPNLNQRFLAGEVNFATLMPMRAIPFRQIWLLGMNDQDYPRRQIPADFDLMIGDYRPGDRSRREDDRYLFLEALLSARDKLVIGWVGRSIRDNSERPPSVLVGQLRDHLAAGWQLPPHHSGSVPQALTTEHPLQPFGRAYFTAHATAEHAPALFTYAREWRAVHTPPLANNTAPLPLWVPDAPLDLEQLSRFLREPITQFFKQRLGITKPDAAIAVCDVETFDLDGLENWAIKDELMTDLFEPDLTDAELTDRLQTRIARIQAQGRLVAGELGQALGRQVIEYLPKLYTDWNAALAEWPQRCEQPLLVQLELVRADAVLKLEDRLTDLRMGETGYGQIILSASGLINNKSDTDSKYKWRTILPAWVQHLAAQCSGLPVTTLLLTPSGILRLPPFKPDDSQAHLTTLLSAWWVGMSEPLPLALNSAMIWIKKDGPAHCSDDFDPTALPAWNAAVKAFETDLKYDAYVRRCYPTFEALWSAGEFAVWAQRLYHRLHTTVHAVVNKAQGKPE
ncbi:DNA helicase/exodeoxyribonuclease V, gamma subunit [Allochromatium warmingii]|uniref:RecBCD enzyme subunit RecC n=1 Tax=Allochromatium warmingii TaxID=61595 RepID=A0A1H3F292_ALLWA|nr:exodeoxyribonuclease V subunit gamma [Allochromatium warmingii]SDX85101.1 DNA helicase/exodeoxyribonuclease V, gamma subunit [Allochromatium warmingii]